MDLEDVIGDFDASRYTKIKYTQENPMTAAINVMQSHGMLPPKHLESGKFHRFPDGRTKDKNDKAGWCIYREFSSNNDNSMIGICTYGSFAGTVPTTKWISKDTNHMTQAEKTAYTKKVKDDLEAYKREQEAEYKIAAKNCKDLYEKASITNQTEYTTRKKINPKTIRHNGYAIMIPVMIGGEITSIQYIAGNGEKKFHAGGKIKSGFYKIKGNNAEISFITEGWATGCTLNEASDCDVYIVFSCNNLYDATAEIIKEARGEIVIAADDDYKTENNPGLAAAQIAAETYNVKVIAPIFRDQGCRGTDFNDLRCIEGLHPVKEQLKNITQKTPENVTSKKTMQEEDIQEPPPGVISDLYSYYMATSGTVQPGFAMQTALAIVSCMCGRYFSTDQNNFTSLYFINIGKSATGKEHCKQIIESVFQACDLGDRVAGDGFTSGSAVVSLLLSKPCAISVWDEFGRAMAAANAANSSILKEAATAIMEAISRLHGILRPKSYSTMTIKKDQAEEMAKRVVYNPALTILGLTTPSTFYDQIKMSEVLDGFLNRFLIYESSQKRQLRRRVTQTPVPESIKKWSRQIQDVIFENNKIKLSTEKPNYKIIHFTEGARRTQQLFEQSMLDLMDELEACRLEALPGRANEYAMRLACVVALSRDPNTGAIEEQDMAWAAEYVGKRTKYLVTAFKENVSESQFDMDKKNILNAIRRHHSGISWSDMQKTSPFKQFKRNDLEEIIGSLVDAGQVLTMMKTTNDSGVGRPKKVYKAN